VIRLSKRSILTYSYSALEQTGRHKQLPADAWDFLSCLVDEDASHAATVYEAGRLIAWLRVTKVRSTLFAQGTWVDKEHRRRGLGKALWQHTLERLRPRYVEVSVVSQEGAALVKSLRREYPGDLFP